MKKIRKIIITLTAMVSASAVATASDTSDAYQFLNIPTSSHVYGLGGNNIAIIDDDVTLADQNPALIGPELEKQVAVNYMYYMGTGNFAGLRYGMAADEHSGWAIGLRYLNMVSRKALELEGVPFAQLIHPRYLGILSDPEIPEAASNRCTVDVETAIRGGCRLKLHAGPGLLKRNGVSDPEVKFVFDQDLYMPGQVNVNLSAGALQTLHAQAFSIFRGAVTDTLHEAMEPDC